MANLSFIQKRERVDEREAIHCTLCRHDVYILDPSRPQEELVEEGSNILIEHMKEFHPVEYERLAESPPGE